MNEEKLTDQEMKKTATEVTHSCTEYGNALSGVSSVIDSISAALMNFQFPKMTAIEMSSYIEIVNNLRKANTALSAIANDLKNKE